MKYTAEKVAMKEQYINQVLESTALSIIVEIGFRSAIWISCVFAHISAVGPRPGLGGWTARRIAGR